MNVVIKHNKKYLYESFWRHNYKSKSKSIRVLATTGCAAYLIGGQTIHSFIKMDGSGNIYLENDTFDADIIRNTNTILIDESSMLCLNVFIKLDSTLRRLAGPEDYDKPFGGKNIILFGVLVAVVFNNKETYLK